MTRAQRGAMAAVGLLAWFAVALQVAIVIGRLAITRQPASVALANTFSFFTILTNMMTGAVLCATAMRGRFDRWACSPAALSAVAVYITVVSLIYEVMLRQRWTPVDVPMLSDFALHDAVPVLTVALWVLVVPKGTLTPRQPVQWLAYPLLYVAYTTIRGALTGWYPYGFIDVARLGYVPAFVNATGVLVVFLLVGALVVVADRALARRAS